MEGRVLHPGGLPHLRWEVGCSTRFIELAGQVNTAMPEYVIDRVANALNDHAKPVKGSRILVMGLAYKPDVDDTRESPSFELINILEERGAEAVRTAKGRAYHRP